MFVFPEVKWRPAEDVSAADDDGDLHAVLGGLKRLPGDVDDGVHGDAALAGMNEPLAGNLQHHAPAFPGGSRLLHAWHGVIPWGVPSGRNE